MSAGISWIFSKAQRFLPDDCDNVRQGRRLEVAKYLKEHKELLDAAQKLIADSINLAKKIEALPGKGFQATDEEMREMDSLRKAYAEKLSLYRNILPGTDEINDMAFYREKLEGKISGFEKTNATTVGYSLHWLNVNAAVSNNAISLNTDSLKAEIKEGYSARNLAKLVVSASYSGLWSRQRYMLFFKAGMNLALRNYLDHPIYKKPGLRYDTLTNTLEVFNKYEPKVAPYDLLKANIITLEPNVYLSSFFMTKKQFGFDARLAFRAAPKLPDQITYKMCPSTFTATVGPVFRILTAEALSKGTVGLEVGLVDASMDDNVWEYFGAKLKEGVPFNALIK